MEFGLAYEMQRPSLDDHKVIEETLEQCILADEMGWGLRPGLWNTTSLPASPCRPCPEVIFGALSQVTKRIRLGFGVVILPYRHPIRVAERVAMVDHLSKGRVEFGTGRSAAYEQSGMGIEPRDTREMWEESLTMIPKIWESDMFEWDGRFWKVPPRKVLPKPYQQPHPPIWVAALQPSTYELAAQKGIGVMALGVSAPSVLEPHIRTYKENVKHANPVGAFVNDRWLSSSFGYCDEDNHEARELCARSLKTFFGPDRPYLQDQKDLYQKLVEGWGGVSRPPETELCPLHQGRGETPRPGRVRRPSTCREGRPWPNRRGRNWTATSLPTVAFTVFGGPGELHQGSQAP